MADALHNPHLMKPALFEPFLPFMNGVLNSALRKYTLTESSDKSLLKFICYRVATGQEMVRKNKILEGQGKVRKFYFEPRKINILKKSRGKLKL